MKKIRLVLLFVIILPPLVSQQLTHISSVVNIEIPVRVFKAGKFVDSMTIVDFEVYEDGVIQRVEAVYLVRKTQIEKEEGEKKFTPRVSRHFMLLFEMTDYLPKVDEAIERFFEKVILPTDTLTVITPTKTYQFHAKALNFMPKKEIADQLKEKLRRDVLIGNSEYKESLRNLERIWVDADMPLDAKLAAYADFMRNLENLRRVDEAGLMQFAEYLKKMEGQKHVFLFYQKEVIPQLGMQTYSDLVSENMDRQDILFSLADLFEQYKRDITFNVDLVKKAFSDSSIAVHFLFLTETRGTESSDVTLLRPSGMRLTEASEDIYSAFNEVALATGGLVDTSANALTSFEKAVEASENYYLLYYSPADYKADGKFRKIQVRVKPGGYRVSHRAGYFAN